MDKPRVREHENEAGVQYGDRWSGDAVFSLSCSSSGKGQFLTGKTKKCTPGNYNRKLGVSMWKKYNPGI